MSKMRAETFKLHRLIEAKASRLEMRTQMESVLSPEGRKQVRQFGPWWARDEDE